MARRRRKKSSLAASFVRTQVVRSLPAPVQFAFENRSRSLMTIIIVIALIGTGIISVQWQNGKPKVEFHPDRARQVGTQVVDKVRDQVREQLPLDSTFEPMQRRTDQRLGEVIDDYPSR